MTIQHMMARRARQIKKVKEIYLQSKTGSKEERAALKKWIRLSVIPEDARDACSRAVGSLRKKALEKWEIIVLRLLRKATTKYALNEALRRGPTRNKQIHDLLVRRARKLHIVIP